MRGELCIRGIETIGWTRPLATVVVKDFVFDVFGIAFIMRNAGTGGNDSERSLRRSFLVLILGVSFVTGDLTGAFFVTCSWGATGAVDGGGGKEFVFSLLFAAVLVSVSPVVLSDGSFTLGSFVAFVSSLLFEFDSSLGGDFVLSDSWTSVWSTDATEMSFSAAGGSTSSTVTGMSLGDDLASGEVSGLEFIIITSFDG